MYKEVTTLTADPPDGIKVFPNEEDLTDLQVTIEGPGECGHGREGPLDWISSVFCCVAVEQTGFNLLGAGNKVWTFA